MFDCFLSNTLVIFLQLLCCSRIFFTKNSRIDSAAVLAPVAFSISLLSLYIWGCSQFMILVLLLSFLVFLTNVRSIIRLFNHLYVDRYSLQFLIFTVLEFILSLGLLFVLYFYRPVKILPQDFNVTKTVTRLTGNMESGFNPVTKETYFKTASGFLYTYEQTVSNPAPAQVTDQVSADQTISEDETALAEQSVSSEISETEPAAPQTEETKPVIIFASSDTAEILDYEPYLLFLAQKGWTVLAADFYSPELSYNGSQFKDSRFMRKVISKRRLLKKSENYNAEERKALTVKSYLALTNLARKIYGEETYFFFVTDNLDYDSISEIIAGASSELTAGVFPLTKISEYKTPGLGFVEQTAPFTAARFGLKRDKTLFIPRYAAGKTVEELKALKL